MNKALFLCALHVGWDLHAHHLELSDWALKIILAAMHMYSDHVSFIIKKSVLYFSKLSIRFNSIIYFLVFVLELSLIKQVININNYFCFLNFMNFFHICSFFRFTLYWFQENIIR